MRYPLVSILNIMYKLYTAIRIEILYKSGNTNFDKNVLRTHVIKEEYNRLSIIQNVISSQKWNMPF